jgi:hypothetical protein
MMLAGAFVAGSGCGADHERSKEPSSSATVAAIDPHKNIRPVDTRTPIPPGYGLADSDVMGGAPVLLRSIGGAGHQSPDEVDLASFVPDGARVRRIWRPNAQRRRAQILVEWVPAHIKVVDPHQSLRWGLTLAVQLPPRHGEHAGRWRASSIPVLNYPPSHDWSLSVGFSDITSDHISDLLVLQTPGTNHLCGPRQAFTALPSGRTLRVYSSYQCETEVSGRDGLLRIRTPAPRKGDSVCCPSFQRYITRRWNGTRYVTVRDQRRRQ